MSIKSQVGNFVSGAVGSVFTAIGTVSSKIENLIGGATASLSSLWDGGFVGLSDSGVNELCDDIEKYVQALEAIKTDFAAKNDASVALKGEQQAAAEEYINAIGDLLGAYCSSYRNFCSLAVQAGKSLGQTDTDNASAIRDEKEQIISDANSIRVDEVTDRIG